MGWRLIGLSIPTDPTRGTTKTAPIQPEAATVRALYTGTWDALQNEK